MAEHENVFIVYNNCFTLSLNAKTLERVVIFMMTNVIVQIANRIQKPPSGAGFYYRWVKHVGW